MEWLLSDGNSGIFMHNQSLEFTQNDQHEQHYSMNSTCLESTVQAAAGGNGGVNFLWIP